MIYQPSFPSPHLSTIDATKENVFRFCVNGSYVDKYQITIYEVATNKIAYTTGEVVLTEPVYGNNGDDSFIDVVVPADCGMKNGLDYKWVVRTWQTGVYDIPVAYGRTQAENQSANSIKIAAHVEGTVSDGMQIQINGVAYPITAYTPEYGGTYKVTQDNNADNDSTQIYIYNDAIQREFTVGDQVFLRNTSIGDIYRTIDAIQTINNSYLLIKHNDVIAPFNVYANTEPVTTIKNISKTSTYSTITTANLPLYIQKGTAYTIFADNTQNDLEFYFQARDAGRINITANGSAVDGDVSVEASSVCFLGSYIQEQNVAIKYWQIDIKLDSDLVASSGQVFNNHISYEYDGLLRNNTYTAIVTTMDDNDVVISKQINIHVSYANANAFAQPTATSERNHNIKVDWSRINVVNGVPNFEISDTSYSNNMLVLSDGQSVAWDTIDNINPLELPSEQNRTSYVEILSTDTSNFDGQIAEVYNNNGELIQVGYDGAVFWWSRTGSERCTFDPYLEAFAGIFPNQDEITTIQSEELCCFWTTDDDALWSTDEDRYFYGYDVGKEFWWLIKINLNENDIKDLVTFTRYYKE